MMASRVRREKDMLLACELYYCSTHIANFFSEKEGQIISSSHIAPGNLFRNTLQIKTSILHTYLKVVENYVFLIQIVLFYLTNAVILVHIVEIPIIFLD